MTTGPLTIDRSSLGSKDGRFTSVVVVDGILGLLAISPDTEFESSVGDIVGVVSVDPSALWSVLRAIVESASELIAVVPGQTAVGSDVSGP